jgi:outer membrane protein
MKRILVVLALVTALFVPSVFAAPTGGVKVGIVNIDMVIQQSPLALSYNEKISKEFKPRQDQLNDAQKQLQSSLDKLTYTGFQMSVDDRNKLRNQINDQKRQFDTLNASLQQDLQATQNKYTQDLLSKLGSVIKAIAQSGSYDIVQTNANILYLNN